MKLKMRFGGVGLQACQARLGTGGQAWRPTPLNQLEPLRTEVNDIGAMLCRLETIRRVAAPWQQKTIDRISITLHLMANNAEDAIEFGKTHQNELWLGQYQGDINNLYNEARSLTRNAGENLRHEPGGES
jgi:hypothetical protein